MPSLEINMVKRSPRYFWDRIRSGDVYSHTRFGDGEWLGVLGRASEHRRNCDGHRYFRRMNQELLQVLESPPDPRFLLGMQNFAMKLLGPHIIDWLFRKGLMDLQWYDADTLAMHRSSVAGGVLGYFEALATKQVVMVGPPHLKRLKPRGLVDFAAYVPVPQRNAYSSLREIERQVRKAYSRLKPPVVISISCGLPAGILTHRLFRDLGKKAFIFDAGSVYDVYCGIDSRKYMRNLRKKWRRGKGNDPRCIRASLEERAASRDSAV